LQLVGVSLNLDLAPDRKRIAALVPVETAVGKNSQSRLIFPMNFSDEMQCKGPAAK
jgi:hypothetical protein